MENIIILILITILAAIIEYFVKDKGLKIYLIILTISLSIIAFYFNPPANFDLSRHYDVLKYCRNYGWTYIINSQDYKSLPIGAAYMYIISMMNLNGFLPAITTVISYGCILLTIYKIYITKKYNKLAIVLATFSFLLMFNYIGLISGIRNKLCLAVFFYFLYMDLIEKKSRKLCFIIYTLLCFIHPSTIVLVLLRVLLTIKNENASKLIRFFILIWSFLKEIILTVLMYFIDFPIIQLIVSKMQGYTEEEAYAVANVPLYTFVYMTRNIILLLIYMKYLKNTKEKKELQMYNNFVTYMYCFVFGAINDYHFFVRMSEFLLLLNIYPIINVFGIKYEKGNNVILLKIALCVEMILFFIFYISGQYQILLNG